jgi:hypothetical protein
MMQGFKRAVVAALTLSRQAILTTCTFIDANRSRLPKPIRRGLRNLSAGVILAGSVGLLGGMMLVAMVLLVGVSRSEAEPSSSAGRETAAKQAPKDDPVRAELQEAKKRGHDALVKLSERYPKNAEVLLEVAGSHSARSDHSAAVAAMSLALMADPKLNGAELAAELLAAAARERASSDAAFELLQGPMGANGATILYDLSIDPKVRISLRSRAETWIRSDEFKRIAIPDVQIAGALRYSKSCSEKHALLPRAAEVGEKRTLDYLNIIKVRGGCGRGGRTDCFPCLRKDDALKQALAATEKRVAKN